MPIPKQPKKTAKKASAKPNVTPSTPTEDGKIVDNAPGAPETNVEGSDGTKPIASEVPKDEKTQPPAPLDVNRKSASADDVAELEKRVADIEAEKNELELYIGQLHDKLADKGAEVNEPAPETPAEKSARIAKANRDAAYVGTL